MSQSDEEQSRALVSGLRGVRDEARLAERSPVTLESSDEKAEPAKPLGALGDVGAASTEPSVSPDRAALNELWDLARAQPTSPFRRFLARIARFALGPVVDRQTRMNSAQVQFDNALVAYVDARIDGVSRHYDGLLGLHGKRMEEIDERHLILQQELVRHVHDLVQRIEFVFETAETNHLYVDGLARETREELKRLVQRLDALSGDADDGA